MFWEYRKGWLHVRMWLQLSWSRHNGLVQKDDVPQGGVRYGDGRVPHHDDIASDGTETVKTPSV
uniref:Uncharacterized protein n=1 Tax=Leviviridae sp. TaxID=2027243 RepID=A0A514CZM6_9VIRU|nr:MAG: hypothetical protein H3BulkL172605e138_000002 [Leviviridae sp.]